MRTTRAKRKEQVKKKSTAKRILLTLISLIFVMAIGFAGIKVYIDSTISTDAFYSGVYIDGISMEGMTKQEALQALSAKNQDKLDAFEIRVTYLDQEWIFDHQDIDSSINIHEVVDQAFQQGRGGSIYDQILSIWDIRDNPVTYQTELSYNVETLRDKLQDIAKNINKEPVNATITFQPDKQEKFLITPEAPGYEVEVEKTLQMIEEKLAEDPKCQLDLSVKTLEPETYAADLQKATKLIATFNTDVSTSIPSRKHNVFLSMAQFDGMVINPGQEVSFNETTGQRTPENGYKVAAVIKGNTYVDDYGGGVCQSSSTIYNAVQLAGLEIVQRSPHSIPSSYVPKGLDATVNWPNLDLKFKNNRNTPVFIHTYNKNDKVYIEIYGEPLVEEGAEVRLESEVYRSYAAPEPKIVPDTKKEYVTYKDQTHQTVLSRPGYKVKSYRVVYKDGVEVSRELLFDDYYRPIQGVIYQGVEDRPKAPTAENGASAGTDSQGN